MVVIPPHECPKVGRGPARPGFSVALQACGRQHKRPPASPVDAAGQGDIEQVPHLAVFATCTLWVAAEMPDQQRALDGFNANQETPTEAAGRHNRGGRSAPAAPNHPARLPAPVP